MPVIELHEPGAGFAASINQAVNTYTQISRLKAAQDAQEFQQRLKSKQMDWAEEDRAREKEERAAASEFSQLKLAGLASPAEIEANRREKVEESARYGFAAGGMEEMTAHAAGAGGSMPGSYGFLAAGLVGAQENVKRELPEWEAEAALQTERVSQLLGKMDPQMRAQAEAYFAGQKEIEKASVMQRDTSRALRGVLRRGKMPGEEEWLTSLIQATDAWDAETGEGLPPWEAEQQFRERYQEWHDDQVDMQMTQAQSGALMAMAQGLGLQNNRAVIAALNGLASGGMKYGEAFRAITGEAPDLMDERDMLALDKARKEATEAAAMIHVPGIEDKVHDAEGLREGGFTDELTDDQRTQIEDWATQIVAADPTVRKDQNGNPVFAGTYGEDARKKLKNAKERIKRKLGWKTRGSSSKDGFAREGDTGTGSNMELHTNVGGETWRSVGAAKQTQLRGAVDSFLMHQDLDAFDTAVSKMGIDPADIPAEFYNQVRAELARRDRLRK